MSGERESIHKMAEVTSKDGMITTNEALRLIDLAWITAELTSGFKDVKTK